MKYYLTCSILWWKVVEGWMAVIITKLLNWNTIETIETKLCDYFNMVFDLGINTFFQSLRWNTYLKCDWYNAEYQLNVDDECSDVDIDMCHYNCYLDTDHSTEHSINSSLNQKTNEKISFRHKKKVYKLKYIIPFTPMFNCRLKAIKCKCLRW